MTTEKKREELVGTEPPESEPNGVTGREEWCPDRIAAKQDEVLDRLDKLDQDILGLIAEFTARLRGEDDEKSKAA